MNNPLKAHLHVLQLEGYKPNRFLRWWVKNPLKFNLQNKTPLVWTSKARFIYLLSGGFWPLMFVALGILKPYEMIRLQYEISKTRSKIDSFKNLKVVGITGSYGKTSVKEFLYQILKTKFRVLRTPESYNTVFGISKVVDLELDESYDYFICEMGAYTRGEIDRLCKMVNPQFGILTGINEQHLERFKTIENTIKAKFELGDYVLSRGGTMVVNSGNELVRKNLSGNEIRYGEKRFAHPADQNIEGAATLAKQLGMSNSEIAHALKSIKLPDHRLTLIKRGDLTIIDDAYSSNTDGFKAAVEYLQSFKDWKVIITPGVAELGLSTYKIHQELGRFMKGVDQVILVGKNNRTLGLEHGFGGKVIYVDRVNDALAKVSKTKSTVLFENDLPDNY
jgi:UDP-N-acetylmuramoyl-tripeptide--D-alanyl-D-alanine ligase